MSYLVTGATGFIGRYLVNRLLQEREGDIHLVVREKSRAKVERLLRQWPSGAANRIYIVTGDIEQPGVGISSDWIAEHSGSIDHLFHVAAVYDVTAHQASNERANVDGTRNVIDLATRLEVGCLHHVSSIAVAGQHEGNFSEDMFDTGQTFQSAYNETKFKAEQLVRTTSHTPWRVYRPAAVVGHSETGDIDKVDGPYYMFGLIKAMRKIPSLIPLASPDVGRTNIVPVDFVANALDHIAHQPGLDGQAFHLCSPRPQSVIDVFNTFAKAAGAPRFVLRPPGIPELNLHKGPLAAIIGSKELAPLRRILLSPTGVPDELLPHTSITPTFDVRRTTQILAGTGIEVPNLEDYAQSLWNFWEQELDPDLRTDDALRSAVHGRNVLITGASSGIGEATALRVALAGGTPLLVARTRSKLEALRDRIEMHGGTAEVYPCDLSDMDAIEQMAKEITQRHQVDFVVNNAGRSIRRSVLRSTDRFHDIERTIELNYYGPVRLVMSLIPHMVSRGGAHVVNISTMGTQTWVPRFSAYIASKSALDGWTRVVATELLSSHITFTTVHMPLVRTPMIAPSEHYKKMPALTPAQAAALVCKGIIDKPKSVSTPLGTVSDIATRVAPKLTDRVLAIGYRVFPDSPAARQGAQAAASDEGDTHTSVEMRALSELTRGIHW